MVNVTLIILTNSRPGPGSVVTGVDASIETTAVRKAACLLHASLDSTTQRRILENSDARAILGSSEVGELLEKYAISLQGISPADFPHYGRLFWEVEMGADWYFWQGSPDRTADYSGRSRECFGGMATSARRLRAARHTSGVRQGGAEKELPLAR